MLSKSSLDPSEKSRLLALSQYEMEAAREGFVHIAGVDEVGRGCIAGPVVCAAVILPPGCLIGGVNDSKKLSANRRSKLAVEIKKKALAWALAAIYPPYLDKINILNATREAMSLAIRELSISPDFILIDALQLPDIRIKQKSIIKGDNLSISIACASIIAKVERDALMDNMETLYPGYGFGNHKGYATKEHVAALFSLGVSDAHRASFEPVKSLVIGGNDVQQPGLFDQLDA